MSRSRICWLLVFLLTACLTAPARVTHSEKNLAPQYRHWLDVEVPYIMETEERAQFLSLTNDAERDNFIRQFWESRNPTPGAEINTFKEEHYRRLAYANEHFGDPRLEDGWRTDRGRIYITLGAPQQVTTYPDARNVRPLIVWFYRSTTPALPPYFYILFYKRSPGEPYTLYSPYQDGPSRLVAELEDLNDQTRSLKTIRKSLGDEVGRLAVSLIPTEPVDLDNYTPSMQSDEMLSTIRGLPDNPLEKEQVELNRSRERVTASILTTSNTPTANYVVTRDDDGRSIVSYLIQFPEPDATLIGQRKDKTLGYDMTLRSHITTDTGKPVYDDVDVLSGQLQPAQAEIGRKRLFAAEERFPLAPGSYVVESILTNNLNLEAHRVTGKVVVPEPNPEALGMSVPYVYVGNPLRDQGDPLPFSISGLRFGPRSIRTVTLHAGDPIQCVFQLWIPKSTNGTPRAAPVQMHYLYGSSALNQKPIEETDETVETSNADVAGNLLTGHTFQTPGLAPGSYRLIIRATQEGSAPAYAVMILHVVPPDVPVDEWTAYGPPEPAQDEAKRALSAKAQSKTAATTAAEAR